MRFAPRHENTQRRLPRIYLFVGFATTLVALAVVGRLYYELL